MNKYYFTFGIGHRLEKYVQIIKADAIENARQKMFETYGRDWAFSYTEDEFRKEELNGHYWYMRKLPVIYCDSDMTFGEMFAWTNRLKNIIEVDGSLKIKRLGALVGDLELATDLKNDWYARSLYLRVQEEIVSYGGVI